MIRGLHGTSSLSGRSATPSGAFFKTSATSGSWRCAHGRGGLVVQLEMISWALIAIYIGLVIFAELCNTAMEAIVDLATQELHPLAKRAKDIAAASVYVLSITAAIVGILVFAHAFGLVGSWH